MSISLNIQNLTESGENIQLIPAEIQYDGKANISSYFETTIRNKGERVIVTEARRPFSDDEERNLTASQSFQKFNFWNLDLQPSGEDKLEQAVKWIDIAKALHDPVSMSDSQGSLKSEPST